MLTGCTATDSAAPPATPTSSAETSQTLAPSTTAVAPEQGADALDSVDTIVVSATQLSFREARSEVASIALVDTPLDDAGHDRAHEVGTWIWDSLTTDVEALVRVGVLRHLEYLPLFVQGVDRDITSDITT